VVAHIPFEGLSDVDMAIQKKVNDKYYLYVQHSKEQGISIIDISKPDHPKAVGMVPWPEPTASSRMTVTGNLAIISETDIARRMKNSCFGICLTQPLPEWCKSLKEWSSGSRTIEILFTS
jgi:hypothetical protein